MLIYAAIAAVGFLFLLVMLFVGELFGGDHDVGGHDVHVGPATAIRRSEHLQRRGSWRRFSPPSASAASSPATTTSRIRRPPASASSAGVVMAGLVYQFAKLLYSQQASSELQMTRLVGRTAEVSVAIPAGGVGQISLSVGGERTEHIAALGGRQRGAARRARSSSPGSEGIRSSWRRRHAGRRRNPMMDLLGIEFPAVAGRARRSCSGCSGVFAAMALFARNYIKVPPSTVAIFYGRKHTLVDEKGNRSTVGFRVVRGGAALRVPVLEQVAYLSLNIISIPLQDPARLHEGRRGRHGRGRRQRQDRRRRRVAARRVGALSRHDHRADQGRHLPDARRPPARDSRHAHGRGDQRRPPGVRAEDDRRGRRRSEEDGRQHRHPDDPADQRRAGLPRRARQEAHRRSQARRRRSARRRPSATR